MDHIDNTLRASVKALRDVVAPAVDPADAQARDQLTLVLDALEFVRARIDLLPAHAHRELLHNLALARDLAALTADTAAGAALAEAAETAAPIADDAGSSAADVRAATAALTAAVSAAAREDGPARAPVARRIVAATERWAVVERAWYLPLGFDPDPDLVRAAGSLEELLQNQSVTTYEERTC